MVITVFSHVKLKFSITSFERKFKFSPDLHPYASRMLSHLILKRTMPKRY